MALTKVSYSMITGAPVNVHDFGAACDWNGSTGTDDTAAIQAAIDSIAAYGTVILDNNYISNANPITIPQGKNITFQTLRPIVCNTVYAADSGLTTNALTFNILGKASFNAVVATNVNALGGQFVSGNDAVAGYGTIIATNCVVNGFGTAFGSIGDDSVFQGNSITLRQVTLAKQNDYAFYGIHGAAWRVRVSDNYVMYGRHSIYVSSGRGDWTIDSNVCEQSWWEGIHVFTYSPGEVNDVVISNNMVKQCGNASTYTSSAVLLGGLWNNAIITGNNIISFYAAGIKTYSANNSALCKTTITANRISTTWANGTRFSIWIYNTKNVKISGNTLSSTTYCCCVESNSSNVIVSGNVMEPLVSSAVIALIANTSYVDFSNNVCNTLDSSQWYDGVYVTAGIYQTNVSNVTGSNNVINGYSVDLFYDGTNVRIRKKGWLLPSDPIPSIYHFAGDTYQYSNPASGGYIGTVAVGSGSPGTFKTFGLIS